MWFGELVIPSSLRDQYRPLEACYSTRASDPKADAVMG
jgi:hypothetical protein